MELTYANVFITVRDGILERAPPSRPAPMLDKPLIRPYFDNSTQRRVVSAAGREAYLHCRVKHLGDRAVRVIIFLELTLYYIWSPPNLS